MWRRDFVLSTSAAFGFLTWGPRSMRSWEGLVGGTGSEEPDARLFADWDSKIPADDPVERLDLLIARDLVPLFLEENTANMMQLLPRLRRRLARQQVLMPICRTRDYPLLTDGRYLVRVHGHVVAAGQVSPSNIPSSSAPSCGIPRPGSLELLAALEQVVRGHTEELADR